MRRAYRFRLYPRSKQEFRLLDTLHACHQLYNIALEDRRTAWKEHQQSVGFADQSHFLPLLKQEDEQLSAVTAQVLQDVLHRVDKAFAGFFRRVQAGVRPAGYPRFKAYHRYHSFTYPQYPSGAVLVRTEKRHDLLRLHKIGDVPIMLHREIEGKVKTVTIVRDVNRWYAVFSVDAGPAPKPVPIGPGMKAVGVDVGLESLLTLSNGAVIGNPRWLRQSEARLKRFGRRVSRRERRSANRRKARARLAQAHQKVREQRRDFVEKVSRWLVDEFDVIGFEDLRIRDLVRGNPRSKSINDAGWRMLRSRTASKAEGAGKWAVSVEPSWTSVDCSACGTPVRKELWERTHRCPVCGLVVGRDWNAAVNVLWRTLDRVGPGGPLGHVRSRIGREPAESTPAERTAATREPRAPPQAGSMKQDASPLV